jgi:hypothetical protein
MHVGPAVTRRSLYERCYHRWNAAGTPEKAQIQATAVIQGAIAHTEVGVARHLFTHRSPIRETLQRRGEVTSKKNVEDNSQAIGAAAHRLVKGEPFSLDGDPFYVEDHYECGGDPTSDVLVIRGVGHNGCDHRWVRRAVQVRDVDQWIAQERSDVSLDPREVGLKIRQSQSTTDTEVNPYDHENSNVDDDLFSSDGVARRVILQSVDDNGPHCA